MYTITAKKKRLRLRKISASALVISAYFGLCLSNFRDKRCKEQGALEQNIGCAIDCGACGAANGTAGRHNILQAKRSCELGGRGACARGYGVEAIAPRAKMVACLKYECKK